MFSFSVFESDKHVECTKLTKVLFHLGCFWFRILCYVLAYRFPFGRMLNNPTFEDKVDNANYVVHFNLFLLYIILTAVIKNNILKIYISIFLMFHNTILTLRSFSSETSKKAHWLLLLVIMSSYLVEAMLTFYFTFRMMHENKFRLFKQVGANPAINKAYTTRKCLETMGEVNVFSSLAIFGKIFLLPKIYADSFSLVAAALTGITLLQQLAISMFFCDENVIQRRIAIFISLLKLPVNIILILWIPLVEHRRRSGHIHTETETFFDFLFVDIEALNILLIYFLIKDYSSFGSGLKEYLKFKNKRISLQTNPNNH